MVYVMLADGFEEIEAIEPVDILRRGGVEVKTVSIKEETLVMGAHNIPVVADMSVYNMTDVNDMEGLILPGGAGHELLDASNEVHGLINHALSENIIIAAICAAPSVLGKKMILSGKRATCFPGFEKYLYDAEIVSDKAVVDGKIVTARGAGAAKDFGFLLLTMLKDEKTAKELEKTMQYE